MMIVPGTIPYGFSITNDIGIHSIDKLIIDYELKYSESSESFIKLFSKLSGFVYNTDKDDDYNSYFDKPACSSYSWFRSAFWFDHCNVKIGKYIKRRIPKKHDDNDDDDNDDSNSCVLVDCSPIIRVEFNPNYLYEDRTFIYLQQALLYCCKAGFLVECDYAVDVKTTLRSLFCSHRGDRITYNDNRYYGHRHSNGRIKLYNKREELKSKKKIDIGYEDSRCELTLRGNENANFDYVRVIRGSPYAGLSGNLICIGRLIEHLSQYEDMEELLTKYVSDKRNRDKLIPYLYGSESLYVFDAGVFYQLIDHYSLRYNFWVCFTGYNGKVIRSPFNGSD